MPIDEFGREIPAAGGPPQGGGGHPPHHPFADPLRDDHHHRPRGIDAPLEARRDGRDGRDGGRPRSPGGGGGPAVDHRRSPSPESRRDYEDHRGGGGGRRHRGRPRADSSGYEERRRGDRGGGGGGGRRHRSRSYGDEDRDDQRHRDHGRRRGGSHAGPSSSSQGRAKAHASERYAEQPMLCQFLWKKELEEEQAKELGIKRGAKEVAGKSRDDAMDAESDNGSKPAAPENEDEDNRPPPLFESDEAESEAYSDYNTKYCLNYVRTFFNHHLDDPWFRTRLSPLEALRHARNERARASAEAGEMKKEIVQSLEDMKSGVIPKKDPDCADHLGVAKCNFVASCRLGVGTKPTSAAAVHAAAGGYHHHRDHHERNERDETDMQHDVLQGEDRNRIERHAKGHLHSFVKGESCVKIMDVPPNVSDARLLATLAQYCGAGEPPLAVYSDRVRVPVHDGASMDPYHRVAYAVFPSAAAKDAALEGLHRANEEVDRHRSRREDRRRRKGDDALPRVLDLDVDCTDVYSRREVDADGRGGAPPSSGKKKGADAVGLPTRRCTVFVSALPLSPSQPVSVLSAAVSSRVRISRDRHNAASISGMLDSTRGINKGCRLDDLLKLLYPGDELLSVDDEDILDISIAYLRRVHLLSFYNGCAASEDMGSVLSYSHPAGTIHLRLKDADEILAKAAEERFNNNALATPEDGVREGGEGKEESSTDARKDMLVTRLNESISAALEKAKEQATRGPACIIDDETDEAARSIERAELSARQEWIDSHSILDGDGRARCSFHFCRKLFKDGAFLHKHLLKKHSDHLRAECAKRHDGPMMAAWDADVCRPVPPVLVDCGSGFGLIPSRVSGSETPLADDPEPELWRAERGRQEEEARRRREREMAAARAAEDEDRRMREVAGAVGEKRRQNFVDPDDMVEEKVELSFEDVVTVAPPPKKKKKKKKSLL